MAKLAIKGHPTRGREIIELFAMMGGKNEYHYKGTEPCAGFTIEPDGSICRVMYDFVIEFMFLTLEEFLEKYPFKLGDSVKNDFESYGKVCTMKWMNDEILYRLDFGHSISGWYGADQLSPTEEKESMKTITIDDFKANTKEWLIDKLHNMIISDVVKTIGDIHDELHKPKYPTTYEECYDEDNTELRQQYKSVIHYEDCTLFASEQDGCDIYLASLAGDMRKSYPIFEYEVIGNIHDNPELLNK